MPKVSPTQVINQHCSKAFKQQNVSNLSPFSHHRKLHIRPPLNSSNPAATTAPSQPQSQELTTPSSSQDAKPRPSPPQGAMSRLLEEAATTALTENGSSGRRAILDSGFSEELKNTLLSKVESTQFRTEHAAAFTEASTSTTAHIGQGSREIANAQPWSGTEETSDSVLRMLDDARKPLAPSLRGSARGSPGNPIIDLRIAPKTKRSTGERLANARDKTSIYSIQKDSRMTEKEREEYRKELKERFSPTSRAVAPSSFRGLAALANERIEDAIARGQFKNIPRGKAIERDARADNPFIDTTEYIMNKMIQRQDIVPPWIEKQQELVKTAENFRARMRFDWKRHVARSIASRGGAVEKQVRLAERYAEAESMQNPRRRVGVDVTVASNVVTQDSTVSQISQTIEAMESTVESDLMTITVETKHGEVQLNVPSTATQPPDSTIAQTDSDSLIPPTPPTPPKQLEPLPPPFRDPAWNAAERSYQTLAIQNLNSIARSYNLQAPDLAKKPYYNLERELNACYADVAPLVAQEIIDRARRPPKPLIETIGHTPGGVLERFGGGNKVKVWDERRAQYGFKEFWRDLWRKDERSY